MLEGSAPRDVLSGNLTSSRLPHSLVKEGDDLSEWQERVVWCLRGAGWSLIRITMRGHGLGIRVSSLETMIDHDESSSLNDRVASRISPPSAREIDHMDWVMGWLPTIPNMVHRRIVAHRMLYDPDRGRCIHTFRDIGRRLRCSHQAAMLWHRKGILVLSDRLWTDRREREKILLYRPEGTGA